MKINLSKASIVYGWIAIIAAGVAAITFAGANLLSSSSTFSANFSLINQLAYLLISLTKTIQTFAVGLFFILLGANLKRIIGVLHSIHK
jgi:hypothetical protein